MLHWLTKRFQRTPSKSLDTSVSPEIEALRRMCNRGRQMNSGRPFGVVHDDFHSERSEGEWGAILSRGTNGRPLAFDYVKRYGNRSHRTLFDWVEFPQHIQGICSEKGVALSFRKDRVSIWHGGCAAMLRAPKGKSRQ